MFLSGDEIEDFDTGILNDASITRFPIMEGFWLHSNHILFFTLDVAKNDVMIEVF